MNRRFHKPVTVQPGRIDHDRVVIDIKGAAQLLLRDWSLDRSEKHRRAMQRCLDVLRGERPPSYARSAFVAAAKEARILLED
jgi:hypothetical protein